MKKYFLYILICLSLLSCAKRTDFYYFINNNTNFQLNVVIKVNSNITDNITIGAQEKQVKIKQNADLKIRSKEEHCCPCRLDSVEVTVISSTKKLSKDIYSSFNWTYTVKKFKLSVYADDINCSFDINDSDLQ